MRIAAMVLCFALGACGEADPEIERGRLLLRQFGCGACHAIPGVAAAHGKVGPPLQGIASRLMLGGVLPNSPQNMVRWIRAPQEAAPRTAMPDLGVSEDHARDMAAYLATLK
jgi:cytochrome c2